MFCCRCRRKKCEQEKAEKLKWCRDRIEPLDRKCSSLSFFEFLQNLAYTRPVDTVPMPRTDTHESAPRLSTNYVHRSLDQWVRTLIEILNEDGTRDRSIEVPSDK